MGFNRDVIRRRRDEMHALGVRVRWAGRRPRLWRSVIKELEIAEELTRDNDVLTLTMCVNYGGRAEIADAAAAIAREVAAGRLDPARSTSPPSPATSTSRTCPTSTCSCAAPASTARATSCSGSRPTPSSSSSTRSGRTSTAGTCGRRARSTPPVSGGSAPPDSPARERRTVGHRAARSLA